MPITTLGFDADDTLWQNEQFFKFTEAEFRQLMGDAIESEYLSQSLLATERRNLKHYGFGIKGFVLSMIETAIEVTNGRVSGHTIARILQLGREMTIHPVHTLTGVRETLELLHPHYRLLLITKGDLFDQERKLAESGLAELFAAIEIVSDKSPAVYERIFTQHGTGPAEAVMIGNSLKSDILPALAVGSAAIYIPHDLTWAHEQAEAPHGQPKFYEVASISDVPALLQRLNT